MWVTDGDGNALLREILAALKETNKLLELLSKPRLGTFVPGDE